MPLPSPPPPFTWLLKGPAPDRRLLKAEGRRRRAAAALRLLWEEWTGQKILTMTPPRLLPPLLLLTLLLAARSGAALARCPGCGQGVQAGCPGACVEEEDGGPPAAEGCTEAGGCLRREGQPCGVYTPNCVPGLQCHPPEEDEAPLRALLLGRGRCRRARGPPGESAPRPRPAHVSPAKPRAGSRTEGSWTAGRGQPCKPLGSVSDASSS